MSKKVAIKSPGEKQAGISVSATQWVANREDTKRLTIDIPTSLHMKLKISSAQAGQTMGEIVRSSIEQYLQKQS